MIEVSEPIIICDGGMKWGGREVSLRRLRSSGSPDAVFENERTERRCEPLPVLRTEIQVRPEALMGLRCRLESFIVFVFVGYVTMAYGESAGLLTV